MSRNSRVCAVIPAAGESQRMNGPDKIFAPLGGKPVLAWVGDTLENCPAIAQVVIVLSQPNLERGRRLVAERGWNKVTEICAGGPRRQDSVAIGLSYVRDCEWVVIHDGARPFLTCELVTRGLEAAQETGAAIPAIPVTDTIKIAAEDGMVRETPPRKSLWAAQTPQVFRSDIIARAYLEASGEATDDASLVEKLGYRVKLYSGAYANIKITNPDDLALAQSLLETRRLR